MTPQELTILIETNLKDSQAYVQTDDNVHFEAIVVSPAFRDVISRVKRQQMVYQALGNTIQTGEVHALQLKTLTPEAWEKHNSN